MVAIMLFSIRGGISIYDGVSRREISNRFWSCGVLAVASVAEAISLLSVEDLSPVAATGRTLVIRLLDQQRSNVIHDTSRGFGRARRVGLLRPVSGFPVSKGVVFRTQGLRFCTGMDSIQLTIKKEWSENVRVCSDSQDFLDSR
jgi:hypothetical protein